MTREEADNILDNMDTLDYGSQSGFECMEVHRLIDKIYDEFENRSCGNCIFSEIEIYESDFGKCQKGYGRLFSGHLEIEKDFCCNKWESKDE